jgi:hypothetical protein
MPFWAHDPFDTINIHRHQNSVNNFLSIFLKWFYLAYTYCVVVRSPMLY